MSEPESRIVLPLEGSIEKTPHISVEVLSEAIKQIDEQLNKNATIHSQLQKTFNDVQNQLAQAKMNDNALRAQRALAEDVKRKIIDLLAPPKNA